MVGIYFTHTNESLLVKQHIDTLYIKLCTCNVKLKIFFVLLLRQGGTFFIKNLLIVI